MMTLIEKIKVMEAFRDGKAIQRRYIGAMPCDPWGDSLEPVWNFAYCDYRVKPEPKPKQEKDLTMTHDQMIAVIQAHKDGLPIQLRLKCERSSNCPWGDATRPGWDFTMFDYRAKPQPRTLYAPVQEDGTLFAFFTEQQYAIDAATKHGFKNVIRLTEDANIDVLR